MDTDPHPHLTALQGEPFLIELTPASLRLLATAAKLDAPGLAGLIERSTWHTVRLLAGEAGVSEEVNARVEKAFGVIELSTSQPEPLPLCQLTPRSLKIIRLGNKLSQRALGEVGPISEDYIRFLETGLRGFPGAIKVRKLGKALGVRFFVL